MTLYIRTFTMLLSVVVTVPVWAEHEQTSYPVAVNESSQYDYAKVIDVQAVTETVKTPTTQQICRQEPVQYRVAEKRSPGPAIFGAILGGLIGNQIGRGHGHKSRHGYGHGHGHGSNRAVATIAGAAIGGVIASEVQYSKYPAKYYTSFEQVCTTQTSWHSEERVIAWDVTWTYRGQTYHSTMEEPPGERIAVRVSVSPVDP